ncbi:(d)CMP kinase [bacterium]|nr:(d)CMP kinase [bacterium]
MNIAIDGPSGSGKSTIAKILAKKLGISYLDTGAMYRGMGYYAIKNNVSLDDEQNIMSLLNDLNMEIFESDGVQQVIINGENVTPFIRNHEISMAASTISKIPAVRIKLVELQRKIAQKTDCVLDGRDIGSFVLPNAEYKFFMTASSLVRAQRRQLELKQKGQDIPIDEIKADIEKRDLQDTTRAFAPLVVADNAIIIDTSNSTIEEVTNTIMGYICK